MSGEERPLRLKSHFHRRNGKFAVQFRVSNSLVRSGLKSLNSLGYGIGALIPSSVMEGISHNSQPEVDWLWILGVVAQHLKNQSSCRLNKDYYGLKLFFLLI